MDIFRNLSPLDHRYRISNEKLFDRLSSIMSEEGAIGYKACAEGSLLKTHLRLIGDSSPKDEEEVDAIINSIKPSEVYAEEEKTHHDIRALVNVLVSKAPKKWKPLIHLGATSMDIVDTAGAMQLRDGVRKVLLPELIALEEGLLTLAAREAGTRQVGRTHGQHAVPITLGYAISSYVVRLGDSISRIESLSADLRGKLSGAVGGYNATSLISQDPEEMERIYLSLLNLKPSEHSTQIVMPEYRLRLLQEITTAFGIIANLADDLRHLQRSEIDEVREYFAATQVGSSTMPQKRNPWNCEHVKSLWKAFVPRILSFHMDQISEHQRDLSNSASARFVVDLIAGALFATARMKKIIDGLTVNKEGLNANLSKLGDFIMAEPVYILLALANVEDAHEKVREWTLKGEKRACSLLQIIKEDRPDLLETIRNQLNKTGVDEGFLEDPSSYIGRAEERTTNLCKKYRELLSGVSSRLKTGI